MAPKYYNQNTSSKAQINLNLYKLKHNQIQKVKIDLTQVNIT